MIANVTYKSSEGLLFEFQIGKLRIKSANFHEWAYAPDILGRRYGDWVLRFKKDSVTYNTQLYISGTQDYRRNKLTEMHTAFERDIRSNQPGRLTWGDCYIDCFIGASSTYPEENQSYTVNDIEIYAPYPFWIEPEEIEFINSEFAVVGSAIVGECFVSASDPSTPGNFLDYPYGYRYGYTAPVANMRVYNNSPGSAPFEMVIYGPVINPSFYVGGQQYIVYTRIYAGETLTINTKNKTVYRTAESGMVFNEFNNRGKSASIFNPIPEGTNVLSWAGTFNMKMTLLKERSEPIWS